MLGPKRQREPLQLRERLRAHQRAIDGGVTGREQARIVARRVQVPGERRGDIRESPGFRQRGNFGREQTDCELVGH